MFNFLDEIKGKSRKNKSIFDDFNIIIASGKLAYIEGHKGLFVITPSLIAFKTKNKRFELVGENMSITELTENTLLVEGDIDEVRKSWVGVCLKWKD